MQQEQSETVLAGKFPARAGAVKSWTGEVRLGAIGILAAALAFPPHRAIIAAERNPFPRIGQPLPGFDRCRVGSQRQHLLRRQNLHGRTATISREAKADPRTEASRYFAKENFPRL